MYSGSPAQELPYSQNYTTAVNTQYRLIPLTHWIHSKTEATKHEFNIHDAKSTSEQRWKWVIFATHDPHRSIS